jgi:iron complex outermembrane receptor protein
MKLVYTRGPGGLLVVILAWSGAVAPPGVAGAAERSSLEEIVVTARLREQSLQSVPLSIAAFGAADLQNRGIESLADLASYLPGVDFASSGAIDSRRIIIRGQSQQSRVGDEVNVATFVDGVYTPGFSGTSVLFDAVERVEVIRGPQSALYGRNSFAGTVNYILKKPTDTLAFGVRGTLGNYDRQGVSGYVSGPVFDDALLARLDVAHNETGGTLTNEVTGKPLNNTKTDFVRLALRSVLVERVEIDAAISYQDDEFTSPAQTEIDDFSPRRVGRPAGGGSPFELGAVFNQFGTIAAPRIGRRVQGRIDDVAGSFFKDELAGGTREAWRANLSVNLDLGAVKLTSLTGWQDRETYFISDLDTSPDGTFFGGAFAPLPSGNGLYQTGSGPWEDRQEISQDLRLSSNSDGPFSWLAGLYYSRENFRDRRIRFSRPSLVGTTGVIAPLPPPQVDDDSKLRNEFKSVYGAVELALDGGWTLSAEGRYTREDKRSDNIADNFPSNNEPKGLLEDDYSYFTPRFIVSWEPQDGVLLYTLAAKGIKSGGFNPAADEGEQFYDTEQNWTYEIGSKLGFLDGRAQVNTSIYYVDWDDQQILTFGQVNIVDPIVANVGKSEVKGLELEGRLLPADWLELNLGYAYTDSKYKEALFKTSQGWIDCAEIGMQCVANPASSTGVVSSGRVDGKQLQYSSKHSLALGGQVSTPAGYRDWDTFVRADWLYKSRRYVDEGNVGYIPGYDTVNLRLGLRNPEWSFEGFCNNMLNDQTPVLAFASRDFGGVPHFTVTNRDGRMCGVTVGYSWRN